MDNYFWSFFIRQIIQAFADNSGIYYSLKKSQMDFFVLCICYLWNMQFIFLLCLCLFFQFGAHNERIPLWHQSLVIQIKKKKKLHDLLDYEIKPLLTLVVSSVLSLSCSTHKMMQFAFSGHFSCLSLFFSSSKSITERSSKCPDARFFSAV